MSNNDFEIYNVDLFLAPTSLHSSQFVLQFRNCEESLVMLTKKDSIQFDF